MIDHASARVNFFLDVVAAAARHRFSQAVKSPSPEDMKECNIVPQRENIFRQSKKT